MTVDQLGREADVVAHHIVDPAFVVLEGGGIGQLDLQAAGGEQGVPERIVLVDVQAPGNPDDPLGILFHRTVEEQLVFVVVDVFPGLVFFPVVGEEFFTFVSGIVDAAVAEVVFLDQAVVFAAVALELAVGIIGHVDHVVQGGFPFRPAPGKQGAAVGPHDFRDIAPVDGGAGQKFKGPDYRVVFHGAPLEDDIVPQVMGILEFQHLVQAVLDDGIGQTGGNVPDGDPFPEALFHLGVHEHRAPGAQVTGFLGFAGQFGEIADGIIQSLGKGFQESAAAGGTGFVQFHPVQDPVVYENGLHVLPTDVQDKGHILVDLPGCQIVGDGFDDTGLQVEGGFDQVFPVTGGAAAQDPGIGAHLQAFRIKGFKGFLDGADGIPAVGPVMGKEDPVLVIGDHQLGGGGTGVDAHIDPVRFRRKGRQLDGIRFLGLFPGGIVFRRLENGGQDIV